MICFPPCKINIGLYVTSRRPDGYHNIETLFYPVPLHDVLEVLPHSAVGTSGMSQPVAWAVSAGCHFGLYGAGLDGDASDNLCVRAYRLLQAEYNLPEVDMVLYKAVPAGAGLGGGSSDATHTLLALNELFQLGLTSEQLCGYAARLGSDCPFFVLGTPALGLGRGEVLAPVRTLLHGYYVVLAVPDDSVSTAEAYRGVRPAQPDTLLAVQLAQPVEAWRTSLRNDFEASVFAAHPAIAVCKETLYAHGAVYASMSGSGSSVYGLFRHEVDASGWFSDVRLVYGTWL